MECPSNPSHQSIPQQEYTSLSLKIFAIQLLCFLQSFWISRISSGSILLDILFDNSWTRSSLCHLIGSKQTNNWVVPPNHRSLGTAVAKGSHPKRLLGDPQVLLSQDLNEPLHSGGKHQDRRSRLFQDKGSSEKAKDQ